MFSTISDFCVFPAKRKKFVIGKDGRARKIGIGKWWINHNRRRQFSGLVYAPSVIAKTTNGKLKSWNGFGRKPRAGKCDRYLAHLRDNICCGNEEHADYLLNWMAYECNTLIGRVRLLSLCVARKAPARASPPNNLVNCSALIFVHRTCQAFDRALQRAPATMFSLVC